jgi:hypothetical protein
MLKEQRLVVLAENILTAPALTATPTTRKRTRREADIVEALQPAATDDACVQ